MGVGGGIGETKIVPNLRPCWTLRCDFFISVFTTLTETSENMELSYSGWLSIRTTFIMGSLECPL